MKDGDGCILVVLILGVFLWLFVDGCNERFQEKQRQRQQEKMWRDAVGY